MILLPYLTRIFIILLVLMTHHEVHGLFEIFSPSYLIGQAYKTGLNLLSWGQPTEAPTVPPPIKKTVVLNIEENIFTFAPQTQSYFNPSDVRAKENFIMAPLSAGILMGELLIGTHGFQHDCLIKIAKLNARATREVFIYEETKEAMYDDQIRHATFHFRIYILTQKEKSDQFQDNVQFKNALFFKDGINVVQLFRDKVNRFYRPEFIPLSSSQISTDFDRIQQWSANNLHLSKENYTVKLEDPDMGGALINTFLFNTTWKTPLTVGKKNETFNVKPYKQVSIDYLEGTINNTIYVESPTFTLVGIPLNHKSTQLYILLPQGSDFSNYNIRQFSEDLTNYNQFQKSITDSKVLKDVKLKLPNIFTQFVEFDLAEPLINYFNEESESKGRSMLKNIELNGAASNFKINHVMQHVYFSINNKVEGPMKPDIVQQPDRPEQLSKPNIVQQPDRPEKLSKPKIVQQPDRLEELWKSNTVQQPNKFSTQKYPTSVDLTSTRPSLKHPVINVSPSSPSKYYKVPTTFNLDGTDPYSLSNLKYPNSEAVSPRQTQIPHKYANSEVDMTNNGPFSQSPIINILPSDYREAPVLPSKYHESPVLGHRLPSGTQILYPYEYHEPTEPPELNFDKLDSYSSLAHRNSGIAKPFSARIGRKIKRNINPVVLTSEYQEAPVLPYEYQEVPYDLNLERGYPYSQSFYKYPNSGVDMANRRPFSQLPVRNVRPFGYRQALGLPSGLPSGTQVLFPYEYHEPSVTRPNALNFDKTDPYSPLAHSFPAKNNYKYPNSGVDRANRRPFLQHPVMNVRPSGYRQGLGLPSGLPSGTQVLFPYEYHEPSVTRPNALNFDKTDPYSPLAHSFPAKNNYKYPNSGVDMANRRSFLQHPVMNVRPSGYRQGLGLPSGLPSGTQVLFPYEYHEPSVTRPNALNFDKTDPYSPLAHSLSAKINRRVKRNITPEQKENSVVNFEVTRPFVFIVMDQETKLVLVWGSISDPQKLQS